MPGPSSSKAKSGSENAGVIAAVAPSSAGRAIIRGLRPLVPSGRLMRMVLGRVAGRSAEPSGGRSMRAVSLFLASLTDSAVETAGVIRDSPVLAAGFLTWIVLGRVFDGTPTAMCCA